MDFKQLISVINRVCKIEIYINLNFSIMIENINFLTNLIVMILQSNNTFFYPIEKANIKCL